MFLSSFLTTLISLSTFTPITLTAAAAAASTTSHLAQRSYSAPIISQYWEQGLAQSISSIPFSSAEITFFFVAPTNPNGFDAPDAGAVAEFVSTAHANNVKALICIGGWTGSVYFSDLISTDAKRSNFAGSIASYIASTGFDGVDIDWEYPGTQGAGGNIVNPNDSANLLLFLATLRNAIGASKLITLCVFTAPIVGSNGKSSTDLSAFAQYVSYFNIMTYEVTGNYSNHTGPAAPYDFCRSATGVVMAVQAYKDVGFPTAQMIIGIPTYTASYTLDTPDLLTLYGNTSKIATQFYNPKTVAVGLCANGCDYVDLIYKGILSADGMTGQGGYTRVQDTCTQAPYLWNPTTLEMITYDDPQSVMLKANFVRDNGLAGILLFNSAGFNSAMYNTVRAGYGSSSVQRDTTPVVAVATSSSSSSAAAATSSSTSAASSSDSSSSTASSSSSSSTSSSTTNSTSTSSTSSKSIAPVISPSTIAVPAATSASGLKTSRASRRATSIFALLW